MPSVVFEPVIPAGERPQTHALDRSATGIGTCSELKCYIVQIDMQNCNTQSL
jgi:hypothetical protein